MTPELGAVEQKANSPQTLPLAGTAGDAAGRHGERTPYPRDKTIIRLFEEAVNRDPQKTALVLGDLRISYAELDRRAEHLAEHLLAFGAGPETMIGICLERSPEMIVAILAVLKAGSAYVPFDPSYPRERLNFMLGDTRTPLMITQTNLADAIGDGHEIPCIFVDQELGSLPPQNDRRCSYGSATDLAYVMYTSGSTGRPKGVMVENRSVVRLVMETNFCRFGPEQVFLQYAPISFDASTFEIWGALLHGATLVLMPPHSASLEELGRAIREHGITTLWLTAGLFHLFVEERLEDLRPLQQLIAGGDALSAPVVRKALQGLPGTTLINGYGPTENTTFTCCHSMGQGDCIGDRVPIGRPIANTTVYLLDGERRPVGPGEAGELWTGGDGVARGYLNAPHLTALSFFPDSFSSGLAPRMYRTGDVARRREDGVIEFLGRIDNQVKILGHRIEPAEIEAALASHPGIAQACVVPRARERGEKTLTAYYVPRSGALEQEELKSYLQQKLPSYMIPGLLIRLPSLPLNANGKVDREALPDQQAKAVAESAPTNPPGAAAVENGTSGEMERTVAAIWERALEVQSIGLDDNFFDIGGDSLLLVSVHSQLQKQLGTTIEVVRLFEFTTVRKLAQYLSAAAAPAGDFSAIAEQARKQREAFARKRGKAVQA